MIATTIERVSLRDRVAAIMRDPGDGDEQAIHHAIDEVAIEVDRVTRRLAVIDPEWELMTGQRLEPDPRR